MIIIILTYIFFTKNNTAPQPLISAVNRQGEDHEAVPDSGDLQRISRAEVSRERKSILKRIPSISSGQLFLYDQNIINNDLEAIFPVGFCDGRGRS